MLTHDSSLWLKCLVSENDFALSPAQTIYEGSGMEKGYSTLALSAALFLPLALSL